jgi:hypothetical protein
VLPEISLNEIPHTKYFSGWVAFLLLCCAVVVKAEIISFACVQIKETF